MNLGFYESQWPKDNLYINCFVHEVMNFRYHWHPDDFELNILLQGQQFFCRGKESFPLNEGDVVLVDPNVGHASYGQTQNTIALVLHFSSKILKQFTPKGTALSFSACHSDENSRNLPEYKKIKALVAELIVALSEDNQYSQFTAKACMEMLICTLCNNFASEPISSIPEVDEDTQLAMRVIMSYIEEHYAEKITLEDIAAITQYNRTYISTLFHKSVGISFYDYVMRVRLQNATKDLCTTNKNLTDVALSNGFSDLKSFNKRFKELLNCLPSDYRKNVIAVPPDFEYEHRKYIPATEPQIKTLLAEFELK